MAVSRPGAWGGRILVLVLGVALLAAVLWSLLPTLLNVVLRRALATLELSDVYATVRHVTWNELVLAPVHVGTAVGEPIRAERVSIRFAPRELLRHRRVTQVVVHGLRIPLGWRDGRWVLPTPKTRGTPAAAPGAAAGAAAGVAAVLARCPHLVLERAALALVRPQGLALLPLSGQVVGTEDGAFRATLALRVLDTEARLNVVGNLVHGHGEATFAHGQLEVAWVVALLAAVGCVVPPQARAVQGVATVAATARWHDGEFSSVLGTLRLAGGALPFVESVDMAWRLALEDVVAMQATGSARLDAQAVAATWPGGRAGEPALDVELAGELEQDARGGWRYAARTTLPARALRFEAGAGSAFSAQCEASAQVRGDMQHAQAELTAVVGDGRAQFDESRVRFDTLRVAAVASADFAAAPPVVTVDGEVTLEGIAGEHGPDIAVHGASARLPFRWLPGRGFVGTPSPARAGETGGGHFQVDALHVAGFVLSCPDGTVGLDWPRVHLGGTVAVADTPLSAQVAVTIENIERPRGRLTLNVPSFTVGAEDTWIRRRHPALARLALSGTFAAEAEFRLLPTGLRGRGLLEVSQVGIASVAGGEAGPSVSGLAARIAFSDLLGMRTEPGQTLQFESARLGTLVSTGGTVTFRLESAQRLFIEDSAIALLGGIVSTPAARIDLAEPQVDAVVHLDRVQLGEMLKLVPSLDSAGSGTFFGKLPVTLQRQRLSYGLGYLYSVPGATGTLQVRNAGLLTAGLPASAPNIVSLKAAENALRDFRYTVLKLDFMPAGTGDTRVRLSIAGEPVGARPGETLTLDVNVRGALEETMALGLQLGRGLGTMPANR